MSTVGCLFELLTGWPRTTDWPTNFPGSKGHGGLLPSLIHAETKNNYNAPYAGEWIILGFKFPLIMGVFGGGGLGIFAVHSQGSLYYYIEVHAIARRLCQRTLCNPCGWIHQDPRTWIGHVVESCGTERLRGIRESSPIHQCLWKAETLHKKLSTAYRPTDTHTERQTRRKT